MCPIKSLNFCISTQALSVQPNGPFREPCPFCGKPFKRLRSHLPHCKLSPGSKTTKTKTATKELLMTTLKEATPINQKNKANVCNGNLNNLAFSKPEAKSRLKHEKRSADEITLTKVPLPEHRVTETAKPKSKWLAKREQEVAKRATFLTQNGSKSISDSQKEDDCLISDTKPGHVKGPPKAERKNAQGQNPKKPKGTTLTLQVATVKFDISAPDLLQAPRTAGAQAEQSMPTHKANAYFAEAIQNSRPSKEPALVPRIKGQADFRFFQTKTSVWDHIKHGLHDRRSGSVLVLQPTGPTQEVCISKCGKRSDSLHKHHTENKQSAVTKTSTAALFALGQTSVQRPAEDMLTSAFQNKSVMKWSPEMPTSYGRTAASPPPSGISSNVLTSRPPQQCSGPGTDQKLGDVRLSKLSAWLCTKTPKSPSEAVAILNRGWQWYYRKYIDVQRGGIGGITMLIAGYCVLSYIWSYPHLRKERWRKYH